jgi:hemolysin III
MQEYMSNQKKDISLELKQEIANSITHGIGIALSIAALTILVVFAALQGNPWKIISFSLFGASLIILYLFSTLYHSFTNPKVKKFFRILDHCSIFILIAGIYTPITLITLRGPIGWTLFGLIWGMAICGIIFKSFFTGKYNKISTLFYVFMGWIVVFALKPLIQNSSFRLLTWFLIGGLCYTLGVFFYALKKVAYSHAIWHLFVLAGSICHFFGILFHVL